MLCPCQLMHLQHHTTSSPNKSYTSSLSSLPPNPSTQQPPMASPLPKPVEAKPLAELLQEQQEPFILEAYLLEKGCHRNSLNSHFGLLCCSNNSTKLLKRSASCGLNMRRKVIPNFSKIARAVFSKLASAHASPRTMNSVSGGGDFSVTEIHSSYQDTEESDRFSSASSTTVFNSCSESDIDDTPNTSQKHNIPDMEKEVATDRKLQRRLVEDNKQPCPVSVLEEINSNKGSALHDHEKYSDKVRVVTPSTSKITKSKKVEGSELRASLCKLLVPPSTEKPGLTGTAELQETVGSISSSQYLKSIRVLQQTKQLLFDCASETVDAHVRESRRRQHIREFLGPELLRKLMCENVMTWSNQSASVTHTTQLLNLELLASTEELSDFKSQMTEIGLQIGDAILEDICIEIVRDMLC